MNNFNIVLMTIIVVSGIMNAVLIYNNYEMRQMRTLLDRRYEVSELLIKQLETNSELKDEIIDGYKKMLDIESSIFSPDEQEI